MVGFFGLDENEEPYSQEFERMDIEMRNFLANCGLFLPIVFSVLPVFLLFQVLKILRRISCQKLHKLINRIIIKVSKTFFWNFYLRALLETAIDIGMLGMMDTFQLNFSRAGYVFSFLMSIISIIALLVMVFWIRLWLGKQDLENKLL